MKASTDSYQRKVVLACICIARDLFGGFAGCEKRRCASSLSRNLIPI